MHQRLGDTSGTVSGMVRKTGISLRSIMRVMWLLMAVTVASCARDQAAPDCPEPDNMTGISFRFNIYTADGPQSRALGVWEEDAAGVPERILDINDLRVLLFDQSGALLKSVVPSALDYHGAVAANDGYYTLSIAFNHGYFDKFDDDDDVPFTVMILANLKGIGGDYLGYTEGQTRVDDIRESFRMDPGYFPDTSRGIPMYGIKTFRIPKNTMTMGIDAPVVGEIDMLRSLCKIEVSDRIANATTGPDGERYPRVTGVRMVSWHDHGYLRPLFDDYSAGLREANIYPAPVSESVVDGRYVDGVFRFYCPEAEARSMRFRVEAILSPGADPTYYETTLDRFASAIGDELVRNHIYRFDVHALNTIADLEVSVTDWIQRTDEFELDDIVSMDSDGFMKWTFDSDDFAVSTETYNGVAEQQLSMLNGTSGHATGTFHIISPKGATWKAYFIPGENGVDAFEFVDVGADGTVTEGSQRVYAEGLVGERAMVHVRGKGPADAYRHWAELVIEVHTVDGTILHAPLTSAMSSRFIVYRENRM